MEAMDKINLAERTRGRAVLTWVTLDWGGLLQPLTAQQESLDILGGTSVENPMAVSDETWRIKEFERDRGAELDQVEISQERQIIDNKAATERTKLALQRATEEYVLAVRVYDAKVRALIMGAKEYAAQVEQEQLAIERSKAELAVAKEVLHLKEVNAKIYYEVIQRAQVEADLARAQVDVAKAHVRALMADIEAGRAEIELVEAEVQQYVMVAEKATLEADVAATYAEVLTKKLSAIKLDVDRKEITAGFQYIQWKLDDMLAVWATKTLRETLNTEAENELLNQIELDLVADERAQDLRGLEVDNARDVFDYEITQTDTNLEDDRALRARVVAARNALNDGRREYAVKQLLKRTWAQALENTARKYVYKNHVSESTKITKETLTISK